VSELTQSRLKELLHYDPVTGVFTWLPRSGPGSYCTGLRAGHLSKYKGYRHIGVDRVLYKAHRLAWLYVYGTWPVSEVDHANGDPDDNRIANLREATTTQNCGNAKRRSDNVSGRKGVYWHARDQKWAALLRHKKIRYYLGYYDDPDEAARAYDRKARELYGEFARTNFGERGVAR